MLSALFSFGILFGIGAAVHVLRRDREVLGVGSVFVVALRALFENALAVLLLTALAFHPVLFAGSRFSWAHGNFWGAVWLSVGFVLLPGMLAFCVLQSTMRDRVGWTAAVAAGLRSVGRSFRLVPLMCVLLLVATMVMAVCVGTVLFAGHLVLGDLMPSQQDQIAYMAAAILGAVSAILICAPYYVALPAAVSEKLGVFDALRQSATLVGPHLGSVVVISLVWPISVVLGVAVVDAVNLYAAPWVFLVVIIVTFLPQAAAMSIVYARLGYAIDGRETKSIAKVFE